MRFFTQTRSAVLTVVGGLLIQGAVSIPTQTPPEAPHKRYDYGVERSSFMKRQAPGFLATTGIHTGTGPGGSAPLRLEIRELEKDTTMWTLYILGMDMLQYADQKDMQSWYQIMGIHGRPFLPFDNVQSTPGNGNHGYCTHVSILFPTWHRPYIALYEQVLYGLIQQIATMYPAGAVRDKYVASAKNFRIPYWDWAALPETGKSVLPASVGGSPGIDIDGPAGVQTIANPLYSYQFQPLDTTQLPDAPFNTFPQTMRYPSSSEANAVSQNNLVAQQLDNSAASFRSRLYNLFTNYHDYATFSNEAWIPSNNPNGYDSIESIHDQIHGLSGSGGHMSYVDYSAFDPLFMLHHTMVDRSFAIWQQINPNSYVTPEPATFSTFTISAGQTEDVATPLSPFRNPSGAMWSSDSVRSTETFGYAYPETANGTGVNMAAQAISAVNKLYGPNSQGTATALLGRDTDNGIQYREWIANIRVRKHALDGPFFIHIFLGSFSADPFKWSFERNLIGTHCIFDKTASAISAASFCNCTADLVTGTMPLTSSLSKEVESGALKSLDPADVEPYLQKNLRFKLSFLNDTEVAASSVESLRIDVVSAAVKKAAKDTDLPSWGQFSGNLTVLAG